MTRHYILDDQHNIVPEPDFRAWAEWFETADRHVAHTVIGQYRISTVFLGTDHNYLFSDDTRPILFETMVFEPNRDEPELGTDFEQVADFDLWRYATWAEAEAGHQRMCIVVQINAREQEALNALLDEAQGL